MPSISPCGVLNAAREKEVSSNVGWERDPRAVGGVYLFHVLVEMSAPFQAVDKMQNVGGKRCIQLLKCEQESICSWGKVHSISGCGQASKVYIKCLCMADRHPYT